MQSLRLWLQEEKVKWPEAWQREEARIEKKVLELLKKEGLSVPELSQRLGLEEAKVMLAVQALRRKGKIEARPKERRERYFKYGLKNV